MMAAAGYFEYNGRMYTPGEIIDQNIDPEKLEWFEYAGAVKMIPDNKTEEPAAKEEKKTARKAKKPSTVDKTETPDETEETEVPMEIDPTESISKRRKR